MAVCIQTVCLLARLQNMVGLSSSLAAFIRMCEILFAEQSVCMCVCTAVDGSQTAEHGWVGVGALLQSSSAESGQSVGDQLVRSPSSNPSRPFGVNCSPWTFSRAGRQLVLLLTEEPSNPEGKSPLFWGRKPVRLRHMES